MEKESGGPKRLQRWKQKHLSPSDEQLVCKYQESQSAAALNELMTRHLPTVRTLAFRMTLCNATADDVTQDVFLKLMRSIDRFRGEAAFTTWLYRITLNTSKEHLRRRRTPLPEARDHLAHLADCANERPEQKVMHLELSERVEMALMQLSPKLRAAIVLTSMERLPAKEAAAVEGCSTATMHWRVHRARKLLKRSLQRYLDP